MATIENLSDDVLVRIFRYVPAEDLLVSVSQVIRRWHHLIRTHITSKMEKFTPPSTMNDRQIIVSLAMLPNLRNFRLQHGNNVEHIVNSICLHCPKIQKIIFDSKLTLKLSTVERLAKKYKKLHDLQIFTPDSKFRIDFAKFMCRKYRHLSLCVACYTVPMGFFEESPNIGTLSEDELKEVLKRKQLLLEYIYIGGRISQSTWDFIRICPNIKRVLFSICPGNSFEFDLLSLTEFEKLEWLQVITDIPIHIPRHRIYPPCFYKLVVLEIIYNGCILGEDIRRLWKICPNLERFKIKTSGLLDNDFEGIGNCTELKSIDVSGNLPGLHNDFLKHVDQGCTRLEFLDLSYSSARFIYDLRYLRNCRRLKFIWLTRNFITDSSFSSLPDLFPKLKEINFDCGGSAEALEEVRRKMPTLKINVNVR